MIEAIVGGRGRVRVGDGEWPASGPDAAAGAKMRIVAVEGGVVRVEALADLASGERTCSERTPRPSTRPGMRRRTAQRGPAARADSGGVGAL